MGGGDSPTVCLCVLPLDFCSQQTQLYGCQATSQLIIEFPSPCSIPNLYFSVFVMVRFGCVCVLVFYDNPRAQLVVVCLEGQFPHIRITKDEYHYKYKTTPNPNPNTKTQAIQCNDTYSCISLVLGNNCLEGPLSAVLLTQLSCC